ncbi:MAG: hypothetical protein WDA35_05000, partial [Bacilli bacterium]
MQTTSISAPLSMRRIAAGAALALGLAAPLSAHTAGGAASPDPCHVGVYRLASGGWVDVGTTSDGGMRWRLPDGRTGLLRVAAEGKIESTRGWTGAPDGTQVSFGACEEG